MSTSADAVLGLGGAVDWETVWDAVALERLAAEFEITPDELTVARPIRNQRDFAISLLCHLRDGSGGEHFVSNRIIAEFSQHFSYRVSLGGTATRAALAMHIVGRPNTVHVSTVSEDLDRLLPVESKIIAGTRQAHSDPHLIFQYPADATVRVGDSRVVATAANRLIYTGDRASRQLHLSPDLADALSRAKVFLISGFNAMQSSTHALRRANELRQAMQRLPDDATVIYEDAGFHRHALSETVRKRLADKIKIYSLNEDELANHLGRTVKLLDSRDLGSALDEMHQATGVGLLVLHTKYFAIAHGPDAARIRPALDMGVMLSSARYAYGDHVTAAHLEKLCADVPRRQDAIRTIDAFQKELGDNVTGVPSFALDHTTSPTTIGLGDFFIGGVVAGLLGPDPPMVK